jgi:hypothetical protein
MVINFVESRVFNWAFSLVLIIVGMLNICLVHLVPGLIYLLLLCLYFPPITDFIKTKVDVKIPFLAQIFLAIVIIMFTLGVSDLGDMIDKT